MSDSIIDLLQTPNEMYDNQMIPGFVQGTVVENNNKDYPGMVKVSCSTGAPVVFQPNCSRKATRSASVLIFPY